MLIDILTFVYNYQYPLNDTLDYYLRITANYNNK
mgnify:CR=1 FL=1